MNPLKQGLKLIDSDEANECEDVKEVNPLKQGLKQFADDVKNNIVMC